MDRETCEKLQELLLRQWHVTLGNLFVQTCTQQTPTLLCALVYKTRKLSEQTVSFFLGFRVAGSLRHDLLVFIYKLPLT